ncbi:MAG: lipopolysaccharide biosynthesis protein [bacterium]|nr:lipopolysaccharide biosynthesis protein [bacterium]
MSTSKIKSGLKWNGLNQVLTQVSIFVGSVILARILSPNEFGTVAMVTIISSFALMFLDIGFSQAMIQKSSISVRLISTVFWLNNGIGLLFATLFFLCSPLIASFYGIPDLLGLSRVISISFILGSLPQIPRVLLTRELNFKYLAIVNMISVPVSYIIGIVLAYRGAGLWSIISQILISGTLTTVLYWLKVKWRPLFHCNVKDIYEIWNYSINTFLNQFLEYWSRYLGSFLLGKSIGAFELGIYNRSITFVSLPVRNFSQVISSTIFPILAKSINEKEDVRLRYLKMSKLQSFFIAPMMAGLFWLADEVVLLFLGDHWADMIDILKLLSVLGIISSNFALNDTTISSQGEAKLLFRFGIFEKGMVVIGTIVGIQYGLYGIVYARLITSTLLLVPKYYLFQKVIGISTYVQLKNLTPSFLYSLLMLLVLNLFDQYFQIQNQYLYFATNIIVGVLTYFCVASIFKDDILKTIVANLLKKK